MRNLLIILWLILIGVIAVPVCLDYMNGTPKDDVLSVIQRETETDDIRVTLEEEIGNKAMYCFQTGSDFGAAVFSRMGERYCYQESTIGNGEKYIDVRLDTGWDVYQYYVTADGEEDRDVPGGIPDLSGGVSDFAGSESAVWSLEYETKE